MKQPLPELAAWYDARAADYDGQDPHAHAPTYWRHVCTNVVLNHVDPEPNTVALDLGCGTGNVTRTLAPHVRRVLGLDCSPAMLARAKQGAPANIEWRQGDLRSPPTRPGLDLITSCWSLHHLSPSELKQLWRQAHAMLPPGGMLVVGEPFYSLPESDIDGIEGWRDPSNSYAHNAQEAMRDIEAAGFTAVLRALHPAACVLQAFRV